MRKAFIATFSHSKKPSSILVSVDRYLFTKLILQLVCILSMFFLFRKLFKSRKRKGSDI